MNKLLLEKIHKKILSIAPSLELRLPPHASHPRGRIPVAHCYHVIQTVFGRKCKDIGDERFKEVMEVVDFCYQHAEDMHICSQLYDRYPKEPEMPKQRTLEDFF